MPASAQKMDVVRAQVRAFEPTRVDRVSVESELRTLGAGFMTFEKTGTSEAWTLDYEEVIYVVSGSFTLTVTDTEGGEHDLDEGVAGDVFTLPRGSTVRYGGTEGTRLFFGLVPAPWSTNDDSAAVTS